MRTEIVRYWRDEKLQGYTTSLSELLVESVDPRRLTLLRETNPDYIDALMAPKAMTNPARIGDGKTARQAESGPVFSITEAGDLHMRYALRVNNVIWADDAVTREALAFLSEILGSDSPYIYRGLLMSGMGLISNNVLHDRARIHRRCHASTSLLPGALFPLAGRSGVLE